MLGEVAPQCRGKEGNAQANQPPVGLVSRTNTEMVQTMNYLIGDIWPYAHFLWDWVVIPTNIGWRRDGRNVMGRGLAAQAAKRYPDLPVWYGDCCRHHRSSLGITYSRFTNINGGCNLIMAPVKPLDEEQPHMSWKHPATLERIEKTLDELRMFIPRRQAGRVLVPLLGCGNGGLDPKEVYPLMHRMLSGPYCTLVVRNQAEAKRTGLPQ